MEQPKKVEIIGRVPMILIGICSIIVSLVYLLIGVLLLTFTAAYKAQ